MLGRGEEEGGRNKCEGAEGGSMWDGRVEDVGNVEDVGRCGRCGRCGSGRSGK